jgi:phospholipid N-methyltransferase
MKKNFLLDKLSGILTNKEFVAAAENRSDSEGGLYVRFVERAVKDYKVFSKFKTHPHYRAILEHVSKEQGEEYLDIIRRESPELIARFQCFKINDSVGAPITFDYAGIGSVSPTTLRYVKVAADLWKLFGDLSGMKIVEVGVGYGGQLLVLDQIFKLRQYHLFDLSPVLELSARYLESHILNSAYRKCTLNQCDGEEEYDLAISNYAFSELPAHVQRKYVEKVLSRSKRGYLTMNSGIGPNKSNKLSLEELRGLLPAFEVIEERPLTSPNNYILAWGRTTHGCAAKA